jgi:acyl carrier protein
VTEAANRLLTAIKEVKGSDIPLDLDSELSGFIRDSFDFFELQLAIEEEFSIEIDSERFLEAKTIRDLLGLVSG